MNLTEVLLASIAAVLVTSGGVYMYGETSDSRAAVRVNEALNLIASNAKAVGPRIAEMSRQDVQKLGIVPESILDRRSMTPNKEANEIAWKSWNAKTGKGGIDLFTAGVREGGKGYFRVYLTGVPSGVCSRVLPEQRRDSYWTMLGAPSTSLGKISREAAESDPSAFVNECRDAGYDGKLVFEREQGDLAVAVVSVPPSPAGLGDPDLRSVTAFSASNVGAGGFARTSTEPVKTADAVASKTKQTDTVAGTTAANIANSQGGLLATANAGQIGNSFSNSAGVEDNHGSVHAPGEVSFNGVNMTQNRFYHATGGGSGNTVSGNSAIANSWSAIQNSNINANMVIYADGAAEGTTNYINNNNAFYRILAGTVNSNINAGFSLYLDGEHAINTFKGGVSGTGPACTIDEIIGDITNSTINIYGNLYAKAGAYNDLFNFKPIYQIYSNHMYNSHINSYANASISEKGGTNSILLGAIANITKDVDSSSSITGISNNYLDLEGGTNTVRVQNILNTYGNTRVLNGTMNSQANNYITSGNAANNLDLRAYSAIDVKDIVGARIYGTLNNTIQGGSGVDTLQGSVGVTTLKATNIANAVVGMTVNEYFDGGDGMDPINGSEGIGQLNAGSIAGSSITGTVNNTYYGGDGNDTITGGSGIGSIMNAASIPISGSSIVGTGKALIGGGTGNDRISGATGIVTAAGNAGGQISGHAYNLLFGDEAVDLAPILNGISGSSLAAGDYAGLATRFTQLSDDQLLSVSQRMLGAEKATDGGDTIMSGGSNKYDKELDIMFGEGGADNFACYSYKDCYVFGGSGTDTISEYAYANYTLHALMGTGNDTVTAGKNSKNSVWGESGNDTLAGSSYNVSLGMVSGSLTSGTPPDSLAYKNAQTERTRQINAIYARYKAGEITKEQDIALCAAVTVTDQETGKYVMTWTQDGHGTVPDVIPENSLHGGEGDDILTGGGFALSDVLGYTQNIVQDFTCTATFSTSTYAYTNDCTGTYTLTSVPVLNEVHTIVNRLWGDSGNDILTGGTNALNYLYGGDGGSRLTGGSSTITDPLTVSVTNRNCLADFTADRKISGSPSLPAGAGNVCMDETKTYTFDVPDSFETGNSMYGGNGGDTITGGSGTHNYAFGGGGADTMSGKDHGDLLFGDSNTGLYDSLKTLLGAAPASDSPKDLYPLLLGLDAANLHKLELMLEAWEQGTDGNDLINGGSGDDFLAAGGADDSTDSNGNKTGANIIYGNDGNDRIIGGTGTDIIFGGDSKGGIGGNDIIDSGAGRDIVWYSPEDTINCGADTDILLNAGKDEIAKAAACEAGISVYADDSTSGTPLSTTSRTILYDSKSTGKGAGTDILLGADAEDLAGLTGYIGALELIDPGLAGATKLSDLASVSAIAEKLGLSVGEDGILYITQASAWSPTDNGSWRNDAANIVLHPAGDVKVLSSTPLAATCSASELGTATPLYSLAGMDKLYNAGVSIVDDNGGVALSFAWKLSNDKTHYVNCSKRLVINGADGTTFYRALSK